MREVNPRRDPARPERVPDWPAKGPPIRLGAGSRGGPASPTREPDPPARYGSYEEVWVHAVTQLPTRRVQCRHGCGAVLNCDGAEMLHAAPRPANASAEHLAGIPGGLCPKAPVIGAEVLERMRAERRAMIKRLK